MLSKIFSRYVKMFPKLILKKIDSNQKPSFQITELMIHYKCVCLGTLRGGTLKAGTLRKALTQPSESPLTSPEVGYNHNQHIK